jgi:hypothetical protein
MTEKTLIMLSLASLFAAACTSGVTGIGKPGPFDSVDTMAPGWENRFALEWKVVTSDSPETRKLTGYLYNNYGQTVRVRLLVKGLDSSGAVVFRRVDQTLGTVPPFERNYFELDKIPAADRYVVTVYSYEKSAHD